MRKTLKIFIALLFVVVLFSSNPLILKAKQIKTNTSVENGCNPVDLIFVLGAPVENIEWVFDAFAMQQLTRCTSTHQVSQIGVVTTVPPSEGNDYVVLPLTPMSYSSIDSWANQREQIFSKLESATFVENPRNIKAGFETAFDLYNNNSFDNPDRKKVIIYIGYPVTALGSGIVPAYFNNMLDELEPYTKNIASEDLNIYAILTPDHGTIDINLNRDQTYLEYSTGLNSKNESVGWDQLIERYGGEVYTNSGKFFTHDWQIANSIFKALQNNTGLTAQPFGCGEYVIDPYKANMELYFFSDSDEQFIKIEYEDDQGKVTNENLDDINKNKLGVVFPENQTNLNKVFLISDPKPGIWRVNVSDGSCDTMMGYAVTGSPDFQVNQPEEEILQYNINGNSYNPEEINQFSFELLDQSTGNALFIWDDFPPQAAATVVRSDGIIESLPFAPDNNERLLSEPLYVANEGLYKWELSIELPTYSNNGTIDYVKSDSTLSGTYEVTATRQIILNYVEPNKDKKVLLHSPVIPGLLQIAPVEVAIQLEDVAGNKINAKDIFIDPDESISVSLLDAETGTIFADGVSLRVSDENPSMLLGKIGGKIPAKPGKYELVFDVSGKKNSSEFIFSKDDMSLLFYRKDNVLTLPILWYCIFALIALACLYWLFNEIHLYRNPVLGEIQFRNIDTNHIFYVLKLGKKGKVRYGKKEIATLSPILSAVVEINIQHASKNPDDGILIEIKVGEESPKRSVLKDGESIVINNFITAIYSSSSSQE
jgi:hypothetical protein